MAFLDYWKLQARQLTRELRTLRLASRDPRVPWYAKAFLALLVGYALSPIDLIPDVIPVLGYLDDLVLLPLGVLAARRMIPAQVLEDCRREAEATTVHGRRVNWIAAGVIVVIWIAAAGAAIWFLVRLVRSV